MLSVIVSLLMVLMSLLVVGAIGWRFGTKRGYAKAQAECRRILEEQRAEWDEENKRLRETAAQEVQTLARERERFALELGQKHLQERQGGSQAGIW